MFIAAKILHNHRATGNLGVGRVFFASYLRRLIAENEAYSDRVDEYGVIYRVEGKLHGPNGILAVVTVWILQKANGEYRFVTLKPAR
jgi:hypothetical protein